LIAGEHAMSNTILLPFQPDSMTRAQLAAVSYLARYSGHTHSLYAHQLRRWFEWCETKRLDPLEGIQQAHVELYLRHLGGCGMMPSSINTMMHGVRGFFRFAHIDGLIPGEPAVYARLPKIHTDEPRTQGLDRLELIRFLQIAAGIARHISPHSMRHAAITNALDPGVPLRDAQILARHADPRTTEHYHRARGNLDRHGVHFLTAYVAGV
jgi:site-specific recombinase XerD